MINLDQVRTLEWKVKQAVQLIVHLRRENDALRGRLSDTEVRLQEMEALLETFKATQNEMETGIRSALEELDHLEGGVSDAVAGPVDPLSYPPVVEVAAVSAAVVSSPAVEAVVEPAPVAPEPVLEEVLSADAAFEEEFAALAAAEAAALAEAVAPVSDPIPEAVELEAEPEPEELEEEVFAEEPAVVAPVPEGREPEQPGLGIF